MKLIYCLIFVFSSTVFSTDDIQKQLSDLKRRVELVEELSNKGLESCELEFQRTGVRHTRCPRGSFSYESQLLSGSNINQLTCGKYILKCSGGEEIPVQNYPL